METDTKSLFQITEAAHACGVSRSTLMRMEEKGLLAPAYVAPESGGTPAGAFARCGGAAAAGGGSQRYVGAADITPRRDLLYEEVYGTYGGRKVCRHVWVLQRVYQKGLCAF